jgi:DNA-3-methyladenine glycosylase II
MADFQITHRTVLGAAQPYSFGCSLRALTGFAPCTGDHLVVDGRIRKAFLRPRPPDPAGSPDEAVVVEVAETPEGAPAGVALMVFAASPLDPAETAGVELAVRRWLSLDDDLTGFLAVADADPAMSPMLAVARGLHQVRFGGLAEGAVYFTLTQRSTQWFAAARKRRIAAERGPRAMVEGVSYVAFPSLTTIGALTGDELLGYAGNRQRADRVRAVVTGLSQLDEDWLRSAPYEEVRQALLAVPGIGRFTAHAILLRVLGRPDDTPLEMAQFTNAAQALYGEPPPPPAEIRARYSPWVGWWAYLGRTAVGWVDQPAHEPAQQPAQQELIAA